MFALYSRPLADGNFVTEKILLGRKLCHQFAVTPVEHAGFPVGESRTQSA
jgi:hypothetical protein